VQVTLEWREGRREIVDVDRRQAILDAAEEADVTLPFGCRTGACATCTGLVHRGEVEHRRPPRALKERHLDAGYVLLCIAEPRTDCRIEVGSDVQADLVTNPWR
jgi:ferredoxin